MAYPLDRLDIQILAALQENNQATAQALAERVPLSPSAILRRIRQYREEGVIAAMREERFLVLPHPEVLKYMRGKAADVDRWLGGMRRLRAKAAAARGQAG